MRALIALLALVVTVTSADARTRIRVQKDFYPIATEIALASWLCGAAMGATVGAPPPCASWFFMQPRRL